MSVCSWKGGSMWSLPMIYWNLRYTDLPSWHGTPLHREPPANIHNIHIWHFCTSWNGNKLNTVASWIFLVKTEIFHGCLKLRTVRTKTKQFISVISVMVLLCVLDDITSFEVCKKDLRLYNLNIFFSVNKFEHCIVGNGHIGTYPTYEQTDRMEHITLPQLCS